MIFKFYVVTVSKLPNTRTTNGKCFAMKVVVGVIVAIRRLGNILMFIVHFMLHRITRHLVPCLQFNPAILQQLLATLPNQVIPLNKVILNKGAIRHNLAIHHSLAMHHPSLVTLLHQGELLVILLKVIHNKVHHH